MNSLILEQGLAYYVQELFKTIDSTVVSSNKDTASALFPVLSDLDKTISLMADYFVAYIAIAKPFLLASREYYPEPFRIPERELYAKRGQKIKIMGANGPIITLETFRPNDRNTCIIVESATAKYAKITKDALDYLSCWLE